MRSLVCFLSVALREEAALTTVDSLRLSPRETLLHVDGAHSGLGASEVAARLREYLPRGDQRVRAWMYGLVVLCSRGAVSETFIDQLPNVLSQPEVSLIP